MSAAYLRAPVGGELVGLKRQHLNLLKREVRIIGTLQEVPGGVRYVEETKTSASRRTLDIPAFLVDLLAAHLKNAPESEFVFQRRTAVRSVAQTSASACGSRRSRNP